MSSTRHALPGTALRQERWASSSDRPILANLVSRFRLPRIADPKVRAAIWFLQFMSCQDGGLAAFLRNRIAALGLGEPDGDLDDAIPPLEQFCLDPKDDAYRIAEPGDVRQARKHYEDARALDEYRDETTEYAGPTGCPDRQGRLYWLRHVDDVLEARSAWIRAQPAIVETEVTRKINYALDRARKTRGITLIEGPSGIGKRFGAEHHCLRTGGLARLIDTPSSNDDKGFFLAISKSVGCASCDQHKASELERKLRASLASGDLTLVFSSGDDLLPGVWQRYAKPVRVNWICSLAESGVPLVILATPDFRRGLKKAADLTTWSYKKFCDLCYGVQLPDALCEADLLALARNKLAGCSPDIWERAVGYCLESKSSLAGLMAVVELSKCVAGEDGRVDVSSKDVASVFADLMPSLPVQRKDQNPEPAIRGLPPLPVPENAAPAQNKRGIGAKAARRDGGGGARCDRRFSGRVDSLPASVQK